MFSSLAPYSVSSRNFMVYIVIQHFFSQSPGSESASLLRTIYHEGCCEAVFGAPSLDRYFLQPALTNDFCDSPTYCSHCSTLLWKRDPKYCDAWWGPSTINVNPSYALGLLFALMSLSRYLSFFLSVDNSEVSFLILHSWCGLWFICSTP